MNMDIREIVAEGKPLTITQVREWYEYIEEFGFDEEAEMVGVIRRGLLTQDQRKEMFDLDITIEDILNGRWEHTDEREAFVNRLFDDWNARIGSPKFGV